MQKVRCADCGLLALTHKATSELREASGSWRSKGCFYHGHEYETYHGPVVCLAREQEFPIVEPVPGRPYAGLARITEQRMCPSFYAWIPGFSPRQHMDLRFSDRMLDQQRQWRAEDVAAAKEALKTNTRTVLIAAIVGAVVTVVATVIAGVILTIVAPHLAAPPATGGGSPATPAAASPAK